MQSVSVVFYYSFRSGIYGLGRVSESPIALRVGQREVNGTKRASVSYYIYSFAYH